jgi:hypothetical protein
MRTFRCAHRVCRERLTERPPCRCGRRTEAALLCHATEDVGWTCGSPAARSRLVVILGSESLCM